MEDEPKPRQNPFGASFENATVPTIENPFADRGKATERHLPEKNPYKPRDFAPAKRVTATSTAVIPAKPQEKKAYQPSFYVSQASKSYLADQIEKQKLEESELPVIYDLAFLVGKAFKQRISPSVSDFEVAHNIRNFDNARAIAKGEVEMDMILKSSEIMPKKERLIFFRTVCQRVLDEQAKAIAALVPPEDVPKEDVPVV